MNKSNFGHDRENGKWTVDHVVPFAAFGDLIVIDEIQQMVCHWSNLAPM
jgi:hypothetical protein